MHLSEENDMRNDFNSNYLMHHGILGQKWGIRRYQNEDGSLTDAGRRRLLKETSKLVRTNTVEGKNAALKKLKESYTEEQMRSLVDLKSKYEKLNAKEHKRYTKEVNKEIKRNTKNGKEPTGDALERLHEKVFEKMTDTKESEEAYNAWKEYIDYGQKAAKELVGKYGKRTLNSPTLVQNTSFENLAKIAAYRVSDDDLNRKVTKRVLKEADKDPRVEKARKAANDYDHNTSWDKWDESESDKLWSKHAKIQQKVVGELKTNKKKGK